MLLLSVPGPPSNFGYQPIDRVHQVMHDIFPRHTHNDWREENPSTLDAFFELVY